MFYLQEKEKALRFGDVVRGNYLAFLKISSPDSMKKLNVELEQPEYCTVLSPCCSIGEKIVSLAPLMLVRKTFFDNPSFKRNLLIINRKMLPEQSLSPEEWGRLSPEERAERVRVGPAYAFVELFIYDQHDIFPSYAIRPKGGGLIESRYYMINFKHITKLYCDSLNKSDDFPIDLKCLQLSTSARSDLREKLANYYGRVPKEDKALEAT